MLTLPEVEAGSAASQQIPNGDVVHARMEFPFTAKLYPLGFPVEVTTNSEEILEAVTEYWGLFAPRFSTPPIRLQIGVLPGEVAECPPTPQCRVQQDLFTFIADADHYGIADMTRLCSSIWLKQGTLRYGGYVRSAYFDCALMVQIATAFTTGVHSACVAWKGSGILLCGDSGAGKSTLSYACAKAGWTYVTDDGSYLVHALEKLTVVGNCFQVRFRPSAASLFPEIEGREVVQRAGIGKPSIELKSLGTTGIKYSQSAEVHHLVMLNRRGDANEGLRPYSADVARSYLRQGRFAPLDRMPSHYAMIDRILERGVYELRYRDLDWAIEQLQALAEGAHR